MAQPSWIGQTLNGRYRIEALLGQGGMSSVYRANDPNLKRVVAIKLIHSHLSNDKEFIQRFEEEAAAIASLRHPNIVQVYDFNSDVDVHYMVLEFVPGETLFDILKRLSGGGNRLPYDEAIKFGLSICAALSYAHQRNIIHRDIKPANIMINEEGQAILMDFGIVKIVGGTSHTATGAVLGTARYISPEVIRSEPADQRSDIYSLGITLYEMLSGRTPFQSDSTLTLMMMHLNEPVPDPRTLREDLPPALVNILLKSLEKERSRRYQSAAEMAADLKAALEMLQNGTPETQGVSLPLQAPAQVSNRAAVSLPQPSPTAAGSGFGVPAGTNPLAGAARFAPPEIAPKTNPWAWLIGLGVGLLLLFLALATVALISLSRQRASSLPTATTASQRMTATAEITATTAGIPTRMPIILLTRKPKPTLQNTPDGTSDSPNFSVRIINIKRRGSQYEVQYETTGFVEKMPWTHIHFFFNTVAPEEAGRPGKGPWMVYGGPRPFSGYAINQTPVGATQMCAIVAHANLTVIPGSGNCVDLPKE